LVAAAEEPAESEYRDWESQSRPIAIAPGMGVVEADGVDGTFEGCCCTDCTTLVEGALNEERRPALDFLRIVGLELTLPCG
jgi:hypothetical protein